MSSCKTGQRTQLTTFYRLCVCGTVSLLFLSYMMMWVTKLYVFVAHPLRKVIVYDKWWHRVDMSWNVAPTRICRIYRRLKRNGKSKNSFRNCFVFKQFRQTLGTLLCKRDTYLAGLFQNLQTRIIKKQKQKQGGFLLKTC